MSRTPPIHIPTGIIVPTAQRCFLHVGGRIEMVDLETGRVLDRADCDAEPVDADDDRVIAARPPAAFDAGRIVELAFDDTSLEVCADHPLLDPDDLADSVPYFERADVRTELSDTTASIVVDVHNRYSGGAPPSDDMLERARFVHRTVVRLDLTTGEVIDRTGRRLAPNEASTATNSSDEDTGATSERVADRAPDHSASDPLFHDDELAAALPAGATPVAALDRRIVYRTIEFDHERGVEQHYLHVAGTDAPEQGWRHLISEVRHTPPPPPPP